MYITRTFECIFDHCKATSSARIDSLSFSNCGDYLVTANDNDEIELYNVADGNSNRLLYSKKYGAGNIQFTHHHTQVIYSSTRGNDHGLRYHSLHHNAYIRQKVKNRFLRLLRHHDVIYSSNFILLDK